MQRLTQPSAGRIIGEKRLSLHFKTLGVKKYFSLYGFAYLLWLALLLVLLFAFPKRELHLMLNAHHTGFQDFFFRYYSKLAEWPLYLLAALPLCWKKFRLPLFYALCELSAGIVVQILKHIFHADRPVRVFEDAGDAVLPLVEGVRMSHSNSFPSGHTSTFFVFATCCALLLAYRYGQRPAPNSSSKRMLRYLSLVLLLIFAALGGYSRIYLSQHFLLDVCVGSVVGFLTPCLLFHFAGNRILKINKERDKY